MLAEDLLQLPHDGLVQTVVLPQDAGVGQLVQRRVASALSLPPIEEESVSPGRNDSLHYSFQTTLGLLSTKNKRNCKATKYFYQ